MKKIDVLCIEDNEDFTFFLKRAFEKASCEIEYEIISNGKQALEKLKDHSDQLRPKLIFLDIRLPDMGGMDLLKAIKSSDKLQKIPVIMLSSSEHPKDVSTAYELGANAFINKPDSFNQIKSILEDSCNFWLKHNYGSKSKIEEHGIS